MCERKGLPNGFRLPQNPLGSTVQVSFWLRQNLLLPRLNQPLKALGTSWRQGVSLGGISAAPLLDELPEFPDTMKPESSATSLPHPPNCMQLLLSALPVEHRHRVLGNLVKGLAHTVAVGHLEAALRCSADQGQGLVPGLSFPAFISTGKPGWVVGLAYSALFKLLSCSLPPHTGGYGQVSLTGWAL